MVQEQPQNLWFQSGSGLALLSCILALLVFVDGSNTSPVADPDVLEGSPSAELLLHFTKAGAGCADLLKRLSLADRQGLQSSWNQAPGELA